MFVFLFLVLLLVVVAFVAGWLLILWLMVKHPILGAPIAVYVGLVMWLGANDAQALTCYVLIALALWRLVHKRSFRRLVGRRLRLSWRRLRVCDRPLACDLGSVRRRDVPPAVPPHPEDPISQIRTVA
jgi:hypothetical protein